VRTFEEYLDHTASSTYSADQVNYRDAILRMLNTEQRRLIVNLDEVRDYNRELARG
jgi:DNA replication licensing factor MCM3